MPTPTKYSDEEIVSADEFTKNVSPTNIGIRHDLEEYGLLPHVHEWMRRYAKLMRDKMQDRLQQLDKEVERLSGAEQQQRWELNNLRDGLKSVNEYYSNQSKELDAVRLSLQKHYDRARERTFGPQSKDIELRLEDHQQIISDQASRIEELEKEVANHYEETIAYKEKIQSLREQLDGATMVAVEFQSRISSLEGELEKQRNELVIKRSYTEECSENAGILESELGYAQSRIKELEAERDELRQEAVNAEGITKQLFDAKENEISALKSQLQEGDSQVKEMDRGDVFCTCSLNDNQQFCDGKCFL